MEPSIFGQKAELCGILCCAGGLCGTVVDPELQI